jgi:predicted Ser/Thr protein kinase
MKYGKDYILNPTTGRYVLKNGVIGKKILADRCTKGKILNPASGRCVKKDGAIGRKIRSKQVIRNKKRSKTPSKKRSCGRGRFLNSKTGRCKKIPTPINEMSLNKRGIIYKGAPERISKILEKCELGKSWKKKQVLGSGSVGRTYHVCKGTDCEYVMKVQKDDYEFRNEVKVMRKLRNFKHAPELVGAWTCKGKGYIVEEKLTKLKGTKEEKYKKVKKALKLLNAKRIAFPDCHVDNVMMRKDGTVVFIDFGWATYFSTATETIWEPIWLSDEVNRNVSLKDVIAWQNVNFEEEFGTKTGYNTAMNKYDKIFEK